MGGLRSSRSPRISAPERSTTRPPWPVASAMLPCRHQIARPGRAALTASCPLFVLRRRLGLTYLLDRCVAPEARLPASTSRRWLSGCLVDMSTRNRSGVGLVCGDRFTVTGLETRIEAE